MLQFLFRFQSSGFRVSGLGVSVSSFMVSICYIERIP